MIIPLPQSIRNELLEMSIRLTEMYQHEIDDDFIRDDLREANEYIKAVLSMDEVDT